MSRFASALAHLAALVLVLLSLACAPASEPPLASPHPGTGRLLAGAAKVDITPLAGIPLGAHSIEGGIGIALWTRLWARAIVLEDAEGEPLVLVVCDLWSIPAGLSDAVIERVREAHDLTMLERRHVLIAATHTHHGPANLSSNRLYNRAAAPEMGFDPELHAFLVDRIADAIASAFASRRPATLTLSRAPLGGLARNRSAAAFMTNPEAATVLERNAALAPCPELPASLAAEARGVEADSATVCRAVDPTLTTLRIDDDQGQPLALAAFFAVHPTAMVNATDAINGDLFAIATQTAEAALARARPGLGDPVVALFNGAEGDVSPQWDPQGRRSTLALGQRLGEAIASTAGLAGERPLGERIDGTIEHRFVRQPLAHQRVEGPEHAHTADRALPGKAILGGAEDGRTRYHERWPEGQTRNGRALAGQGPKRPVIPPGLFWLGFPRWTMPQEVPLSTHRVGPLVFAGLPGEFTTVMGMQVREHLREAVDEPLRPILIGLADEYAGYFVTPHEYGLQHYEGGSTLWGRYAGRLIAQRLAALLASSPGSEPASEARFDPGAHRRLSLRPGSRAHRLLDEIGPRLREQLEIDQPIAVLEFESAPPSWDGPTWPRLRVEVAEAPDQHPIVWAPLLRDGTPVDTLGAEFVLVPIAVERGRWIWQAWWIGELPERATLRLHVLTAAGDELCSAPFSAPDGPTLQAVACHEHPKRERAAGSRKAARHAGARGPSSNPPPGWVDP